MRYPASEKLEIIRLVEQSHLPAKQTLGMLGVPRTTFYRWYERYRLEGQDALRCIRSMVHDVDGQRILVVECLPATSPVYLNRDNQESFFVRMSNTTQDLKPSEVLAYVDEHFR